jgi:hypothetical protein
MMFFVVDIVSYKPKRKKKRLGAFRDALAHPLYLNYALLER